ncbi:MAG TPA: acyl-CoA dehydrogenase family protein [Pseudogracilibacillus sp.]|nr:acyl-CoA dehydrogenase family protein [Pseudogracilibacillus sp.]
MDQIKAIFPYEGPHTESFSSDELSEEEQLIATMIEQFVEEQVLPQNEALEANDYEVGRGLFQASGELGLLGAEVPEAYGGIEMGKKVSGLVAEKMGFGASFSVGFNIHTGVGTLPYVYFGTEEQKERYLPKLSSGEWVGAYALTEPGAGSDALSGKASAKKTDDGWILNGDKQWITNAHMADVYVVFARSEEGITSFIVERTMEGVSVGPEEDKLGIRGSSTATLILDNVLVPEENVLGVIGKGHHIALNILNLARLKLAFSNVGMSKQALNEAVEYGKVREQFKQPLVKFPMIQEKLVNSALEIFGAESSTYYTAGILDHLNESLENEQDIVKSLANYQMDCAINKVYASETLDKAVDEALQIHGGYGYMKEYPIERMYRDARINRLFEGTNEINRLTIAKAFLANYYKDNSIIDVELDESADDVTRFTDLSVRLLQMAVSSLPEMDRAKMDAEQETLRLVADMLSEIYVLKASLLRPSKDETKQTILEIMSEETYRKVEAMAISVLSSIEDADERKAALDEVKSLPVPVYSNIIAKKRVIAEKIINKDGYYF